MCNIKKLVQFSLQSLFLLYSCGVSPFYILFHSYQLLINFVFNFGDHVLLILDRKVFSSPKINEFFHRHCRALLHISFGHLYFMKKPLKCHAMCRQTCRREFLLRLSNSKGQKSRGSQVTQSVKFLHYRLCRYINII